MLGHFRQDIQGIENLKIAFGPAQQILAGRFRETVHPIVTGLVDDLALPADFHHPRLAEGAPQEILDQPLDPGAVPHFQSHALLAMFPLRPFQM